MISILIPVYNYDIENLILDLSKEIIGEGMESQFEVLVFDDGSTNDLLKSKNKEISERFGFIKYFSSNENLGRSKSRNYLSKIANRTYCLLLDCDTIPDKNDFLKKYLKIINEGTKIACGGISYIKISEISREKLFYLKFSNESDAKNAKSRNIAPWQSFLSSNFLVERSILIRFPFDEDYIGYGYEDLDWAVTLDANNLKILHIDNTVTHKGLIDEDIFFNRSSEALVNYVKFSRKYPKYFHETKISKVILLLRFFPIFLLRIIDNFCIKVYFSNRNGFFIRVFAFQTSKAVKFEIEKRSYS